MYPHQSFVFTTFSPTSFWAQRRDVVRKNTLRFQLKMMKETGRYDAFKLEWKPIYDEPPTAWPIPRHLFWDSDVAKWIEGACYFLEEHHDEEIENAVKDIVSMIKNAAQPDGYLNIHYTVVAPKDRFSNIRDMHELYNAGHLIEASLAHYHHYKNDELLAPIIRYVSLLHGKFGPGEDQLHGYPGHPEIELALLRLYEVTRDHKHLELARFFIEERGNPEGTDGDHFYVAESKARGEREHEMPTHYQKGPRDFSYQQAHARITEQETIEGHSVRAMYLLTAVADLARLSEPMKSKYTESLVRLWENMVDKKMYLTGGIGAIERWEGFGIDYFLPLGTDEGGCYAETCAAIGVMILAERMLQIDLNRKYSDIMELCLFNAVLTAMSADGKAFTYTNQLASSDHDPSERQSWFDCACCPPNISRTFGILGGYFSSFEEQTEANTGSTSAAFINLHLYADSALKFQTSRGAVELRVGTDYPWSGTISFSLALPHDLDLTIRLRWPSWSPSFTIVPMTDSQTLTEANTPMKNGYLTLSPEWLKSNPTFVMTFSGFAPRLLSPPRQTNQDVIAVARGPLICCVEDVDNHFVPANSRFAHFRDVRFDSGLPLTEQVVTDQATGERYFEIRGKKAAILLAEDKVGQGGQWPARTVDGKAEKVGGREELAFVPFYFRANRGGKGMMRVALRAWRA